MPGEPVGLDPPDQVLDVRGHLRELGYIWQLPGRNDWEPGIPSLMDYVRVQAAITPEPAPTLPGPRVTRAGRPPVIHCKARDAVEFYWIGNTMRIKSDKCLMRGWMGRWG